MGQPGPRRPPCFRGPADRPRADMNDTGGSHIDDLVKLSFFTEMGKAITSARTLRELLDRLMEHIGTIFAPRYWSVLLRNRRTGELTFRLVIGEGVEGLRGQKLARGEGVAGWIAESGDSVIITDVHRDVRFNGRIDGLTGFRTQSIIGVPLKSKGRVFGVVELINKLNGEPFTAYELKILNTMADFAAISIEKIYYLRAFQRMATIDPLTGVYNRRSLDRFLAREIERCRRYGQPLSALWVDIDDFKRINDQFGHLAGDRILKQAAAILVDAVRLVDAVFRYGGDEFIVLLPNTKREHAEVVRSRITAQVAARREMPGEFPFRLSIGLHSAGPEGVEDILAFSDRDLYRQKDRAGRDLFRESDRIEEGSLEELDSHLDEFLDEEEKQEQVRS